MRLTKGLLIFPSWRGILTCLPDRFPFPGNLKVTPASDYCPNDSFALSHESHVRTVVPGVVIQAIETRREELGGDDVWYTRWTVSEN